MIARSPTTAAPWATARAYWQSWVGRSAPRNGSNAVRWSTRNNTILHFNFVCAFARLREIEPALDLLASVIDKASQGWLVWLDNDTDLDPLRATPALHRDRAEGQGALYRCSESRIMLAATVRASVRHAVPDGLDLEEIRNRTGHRCERLVELRRSAAGRLSHAGYSSPVRASPPRPRVDHGTG